MEVGGGTNWNLTSFLRKYVLSASGHSLSIICTCGLNPRLVRCSCIFVITRIISCCERFFIDSARIAFMSSAKRTMTYLLPLLDVMGNRPVWSLNTLPLNSIILNNIIFFARTGAGCGSVVITVSLIGV